jgi:hypothetical protein
MKQRVLVLAIVLFAACGGDKDKDKSKDKGAGAAKLTCDDYGKRLAEVGKQDAELGEMFRSSAGEGAVAKMVADCVREQWTQDELGCVVAAKTIDDMTACAIPKR